MRGHASWTAARQSKARHAWEVEIQERRKIDVKPRRRLERIPSGRTGLERGMMRKQKTERQRREKAER